MFVLASTYLKQLEKNGELLNKIDEKDRLIKMLHEQIDNRIVRSACEIDFNVINAFSVERNVNDNRPCTIIGYFIDNSTAPLEWYLFCSDDQHHKIVTQFKEHKESKGK
jgi:hypothetical protein